MARRKKPTKPPKKAFFDDLSPHAKQAIGAVGFVVLGIFVTLSLFDYAGMVGTWTNVALDALFGGGRYLAPFVCGFYVYALLNPKDDEEVSTSKVFGIAVMFVTLLGFLTLSSEHLGGWVGWLIHAPLFYLMGDLATGVMLGALFFVGVFLTFNTGLRLPRFKKPEADEELDDEFDDIGLELEEPVLPDVEAPIEDEADEEEVVASKLSQRLGLTKKTDFMVTSFKGTYAPPPLSLLKKDRGKAKTGGDIKANSLIIKRTLKNFGIEVEMDEVEIGPTVTRYSLKPAQGIKIARIVGLQRELELNLAAGTIRIEAPIPGKSLVGIEVPNAERASVGLASLLATPEYTDSHNPLLIALGKDITGKAHFANIARMPHGLIAGTTGSGKSVMIHNLVISLLFRNSPDQLRFIMVDPKRVELTLYDGIPHLLTPVITDAKRALLALKWAVKEMERRYDILQTEKVQNIGSYHDKIYQPALKAWQKDGELEEEKQNLPESLPYLVIIMDELADLMHKYPKELEALIVRIAQMARAVGIHLILATQRPSVNVITGTIKANIPTRLAMKVASQIDSRTILDQVGAEKLIGQGDMLYITNESQEPTRLQSAYVSEEELKNVINYLKNLDDIQSLDELDLEGSAGNDSGSTFSSLVDDDEAEDELYEEAKQAVIEAGKASTSYLQRKLRIGYSRAARLMDILEDHSVIGPQDGSKPREILIGRGETATELSDDEDADRHV